MEAKYSSETSVDFRRTTVRCISGNKTPQIKSLTLSQKIWTYLRLRIVTGDRDAIVHTNLR
jgi:hypothetical protein